MLTNGHIKRHGQGTHEQTPKKHTQHLTVQWTKISREGLERKIEIKHKITTSQKNSIQKDQLMKISSSSFWEYIEHKNGTYAWSSGHQTLILEPTKFSPYLDTWNSIHSIRIWFKKHNKNSSSKILNVKIARII